MARRFGRNQRRRMREDLFALEAQLAAEKARSAAERNRMRKDFDDFLSQCRMVDERGCEIRIDVTAIAREFDRVLELRTRLMNGHRDDLYYSYRVDPFLDLARDRSNFIRVAGAHIASAFADQLQRVGGAAEW